MNALEKLLIEYKDKGIKSENFRLSNCAESRKGFRFFIK